MLWMAFMTCFFGFLRSGEICLETNDLFDPARDLTFSGCWSRQPRRSQAPETPSKTFKDRPYSEGSDIFISRTYNELCPLSALLAWLTQRESDARSPLLYFQSGVPLTRSTVVIHFKEALTTAGIDPMRFTGHSFWIGPATTAAKKGLSDSAIKRLGWWKSSAYQRYIKPSPSTLGTLASALSRPNGP